MRSAAVLEELQRMPRPSVDELVVMFRQHGHEVFVALAALPDEVLLRYCNNDIERAIAQLPNINLFNIRIHMLDVLGLLARRSFTLAMQLLQQGSIPLASGRKKSVAQPLLDALCLSAWSTANLPVLRGVGLPQANLVALRRALVAEDSGVRREAMVRATGAFCEVYLNDNSAKLDYTFVDYTDGGTFIIDEVDDRGALVSEEVIKFTGNTTHSTLCEFKVELGRGGTYLDHVWRCVNEGPTEIFTLSVEPSRGRAIPGSAMQQRVLQSLQSFVKALLSKEFADSLDQRLLWLLTCIAVHQSGHPDLLQLRKDFVAIKDLIDMPWAMFSLYLKVSLLNFGWLLNKVLHPEVNYLATFFPKPLPMPIYSLSGARKAAFFKQESDAYFSSDASTQTRGILAPTTQQLREQRSELLNLMPRLNCV
jgi:hypothetical protein